jgi:hypothetical protein
LVNQPDRIEQARRNLTNPRVRLAAEVGWLPGVSPSRAGEIVRGLAEKRLTAAHLEALPSLARANLIFAQLDLATAPTATAAEASLLQALSVATQISPSDVLREIDEDRAVAGVPLVRNEESVVQAIEAHRGLYLQILRDFLDRLPTAVLIDTLTSVVEEATEGAHSTPTDMLVRLMDTYELEALAFLAPELETISELANALLANAPKGAGRLEVAVRRLVILLKRWDHVAQPLQLIRQSQGESHQLSRELANRIRGVCVQLVNEHRLIDTASTITAALSDVFAEVIDVREALAGDVNALEDLRAAAGEHAAEEARNTYSARVGLGQTILSIDPREVAWGSQRFRIDEVDRVWWGSTRHSVNGIPTGTTHVIGFGAGGRQCDVSTRSTEVFEAFTSRLWRLCGVSIAVQMIERAGKGETQRVGGIAFTNDKVVLRKSRLLGAAEHLSVRWADVHVGSANGEFCVQAKADPKFRATASYQSDANTHVLANMITSGLQRGKVRLTDILS